MSEKLFYKTYWISAGKFRRYHNESLLSHLVDIKTLVLNGRDFFRTLVGIFQALKILKQLKPDVVFSKGGYVGVPVGLAAGIQKIPLVTHDSDAVVGLANRIIGRFASIHAVGMPTSNYPYPKASIRYTGIPIDERFKPLTPPMQKDFKRQLGISPDSLVLLVGGAGHGAKDINDKILDIVPKLLREFPKLYIIHIAGQNHQEQVSNQYRLLMPSEQKRVRVLGFTTDFYKYSGAADLVISRSGATIIAELAAQQKALILIPAPQLTGGHQLKNAALLKRRGAALVVNNNASSSQLFKAISQLLKDDKWRNQMANKLGSLSNANAAQHLAQLLLDIARQKSTVGGKLA
jgi:UDP-N-acetylglucosamine--N-acetylmuramyl-(pentapeptide) pyrophosphoryl-undecaprenol N-acetylglucosamine transferase